MPASKVFPRLKELLGLEDYMAVLNFMVTKIVANFKVPHPTPPLGDFSRPISDFRNPPVFRELSIITTTSQ